MTYSRDGNAQQMERELKMWWTQVSEARAVYRQDPADPILADYLDELEVLHDMTDWPALKALAARTLVIGAEKIANAAAQRAADIAQHCPAVAAITADVGTTAIATG